MRDKFLQTAIHDGRFKFYIEHLSDFELATLTLSKDAIDFSDFTRFVELNNSRLTVLEDVSIDIGFSVKTAKVSGGQYNDQLTEMLDTSNGNSAQDFFKKIPRLPGFSFLSKYLE